MFLKYSRHAFFSWNRWSHGIEIDAVGEAVNNLLLEYDVKLLSRPRNCQSSGRIFRLFISVFGSNEVKEIRVRLYMLFTKPFNV
jgi:hypothetical protein